MDRYLTIDLVTKWGEVLCAAGRCWRECSKGRKLVDTSGGKLPAALQRRTTDRPATLTDLWCYISKPGNQSRSCFPLPRRSHSHSVSLSSQQPKKTEDGRSSSAAIHICRWSPSWWIYHYYCRLNGSAWILYAGRDPPIQSAKTDSCYLLKREWLRDKLLVRLKRSIGLIVCNINAAVLIIYLHC